LLASLYRYEFPSDFHRTDTPPDLSYRSSIVWVNFVHGLNLAQAFEPERVSRMTFQQLVDFPLEQSSTANEQELAIIAWCRIPPAVDWAIANGILLEDKDAIYTEEAQKRVIKALDNHAEALKTAVKQMDVDFPKRPEMADQAIRRVFGNQVFTTDGRKLAKYFGPDPLAGSFRQVPDVTQPRYSFRDVYMWKGHANQDWRITRKDGETLTSGLISFDSEGNLKSTASWIPQHLLARKLPDINELFETRYRTHLKATKNAYRTLLTSLFCSLPHDARQAIEYGETKIYTLRASTTGLELAQETHTLTMPLRLRMGFILRLSYNGQTRWYECLPRSGIIRERSDMTTDMLDGRITTEQWRLPRTTVSVTVRRGQRIPFDWNAQEKGRLPQNDATCEAIIEQFGEPFTPEPPTGSASPISSSRTARVAHFIATSLFYYDEDSLYASARQQTTLERAEKERHTLLIKIVPFVPIFGNLDDLGSDNPNRRVSAIFGLFSDALSFAAPVGKFFSGTAKLASTAIRSGFKAELPEFLSELRKLATASLQNFNPLDGVPTLTKSIGRGIYAANRVALNKATNSIARLAGRTGRYDFVKGLPQVADPGHYRLLSASDELISVRTIDDIPARNISNTALPDYRMLDPVANKPFGPALINRVFGLTVGRSSYRPLQATDQHVLVGVAENANIREIPEIDGRTTMFINDEPYRLDGDWLRRVEQIDQSAQFKRRPCRIKRAPTKSVCIDEFVTGDAHIDTPEPRSFEESKGFAPWFGERLCTPKEISGQDGRFFLRDGLLYRVLNDDVKLWTSNMTRLGFPSAWPQPKHNILADVLFQKGIYARIKIQGTYIGSDELHRVGAIAVPSTDGKTTHVFTIVNTDKCYLAQVPADKKLNEVQTLSMRRLFKAELEKGTLGEELRRIYEGSLTANNLAATYGIDAVEKAMRTMDEIAIPLGTSSNPPANMKWVKVDTTSGEALLFDNSTRMIVSQLQNGVTSWSRSKNATPALRKRCADIFDTLFVQRGTLPLAPDDDLRINQTMSKLQKMLPGRFHSHNPRNIAYADLVTSTGIREVYVSVSGGQGLTAELPLFRPPFRPDKVIVGNTTYFNIDFGQTFAKESLKVSSDGKILAIPRMERNKTRPTLPPRPTSLDSEAKLISVLREKYPDNNAITSIDVATTMPPCNSCAVVIKEFGYDGTTGTLNVLWS